MAAARRFRPAHLVALVLIAPPLYKLGEWAWPAPAPRKLDARAVAAGGELFNHVWTAKDPLSSGDGLGPVFNATSCVECHFQGGPGGGGPVENNVTVFGFATHPPDKTFPAIGVVHAKAIRPEFQETLSHVSPDLPGTPSIPLPRLLELSKSCGIPAAVRITQRNTPALFGDGLLDAIPEASLYAEQRRNSSLARVAGLSRAKDARIRGRVALMPDGRLGRFGWKAEFASLDDFVRAACASELGLSNPSRPQAISIARRDYKSKGVDLSDAQCVLMGDFIRDLAAPVRTAPVDPAEKARVQDGEEKFAAIGCADCHKPDLGTIKGFYSNLLLHDMGADLASSTGTYGEPPSSIGNDGDKAPPSPSEWRTPPLWGVADSAPYLHDGRAATLESAITLHAGEAVDVVARFNELPGQSRENILAFLRTLRAPAQPRPRTIATTAAR